MPGHFCLPAKKCTFAAHFTHLNNFKPLAEGQVIRAMAQVLPTEGDEQILSAKGSGIVRIPGGILPEGKSVSAGQTLLLLESGTAGSGSL